MCIRKLELPGNIFPHMLHAYSLSAASSSMSAIKLWLRVVIGGFVVYLLERGGKLLLHVV